MEERARKKLKRDKDEAKKAELELEILEKVVFLSLHDRLYMNISFQKSIETKEAQLAQLQEIERKKKERAEQAKVTFGLSFLF